MINHVDELRTILAEYVMSKLDLVMGWCFA